MHRVTRFAAAAAAAAAVLLLLPAVASAAQAPAAPATTTLTADGLQQPVEIIRDRWGIAHIYAKNEHDLFFAQGYNAARDRLFQFEMWRRQATGTVAEILGPTRAAARHRRAALHVPRRPGRGAELLPPARRGHRAGLRRRRERLDRADRRRIRRCCPSSSGCSASSRAGGRRPWSSRGSTACSANINQELNYAQAIRVLGVDKVKELSYFQPANPDLKPDPAVDLSLLSSSDSRVCTTPSGVRFASRPTRLPRRGAGRHSAAADLQRRTVSPSAVDLSLRREDIGSNNWVVSGRLTQSHYPDAWRTTRIGVQEVAVAPLLGAPGGAGVERHRRGEPVLPGVSIGHNEYGAWGLTVFGNDSEDLYVYDTNPANPLQYKYQGGWETMRVIKRRFR